jgi:hypothetical protein
LQIIKLTYYWVYKLAAEFVARELRIGSEHTLLDWCMLARDVCMSIVQADNDII